MSPAQKKKKRAPAIRAFALPAELGTFERHAATMTREVFAKHFCQPFLVLARTESLVTAIDAARRQPAEITATSTAALSTVEAPLAFVSPIRARKRTKKAAAITLGRSSKNDITLPVPSISATQLQFTAPVAPGTLWMARDMGSKNGTFIDGVRMIPGQPYELRSGTQLEIARDVTGSFWEPDQLWQLFRNPARLQELLKPRPQQIPEQW